MHTEPLALLMRPRTIDELIGQQHLVGEGKIIRRMVESHRLSSMILYGPPGIGKTSIASAISGSTHVPFRTMNAATGNKKNLEAVVAEAKMSGKLILLLDEVHRLDKPKQDFLLPHLENGLITLVGATTSNPYHAINPAIRSRCQIFELKPLTIEEVQEALFRALRHPNSPLAELDVSLEPAAAEHLAFCANGDVRTALNALELAAFSTQPDHTGLIKITVEVAAECAQRKALVHDKDGDAHYDVLSALQKSIRGSDVDAALHYMARLCEAGDMISLLRRLLVIAYEDVGLANPQAGPHMLAAVTAAEKLGFPEARIPLAVAVIECCLSPKSNSAILAIDAAAADVIQGNYSEIPTTIRDSNYASAKKLGRGVDYKYPHDYQNGWVYQQYLPDSIKDKQYYHPKQTGKYEQALSKIVENLNEKKRAAKNAHRH